MLIASSNGSCCTSSNFVRTVVKDFPLPLSFGLMGILFLVCFIIFVCINVCVEVLGVSGGVLCMSGSWWFPGHCCAVFFIYIVLIAHGLGKDWVYMFCVVVTVFFHILIILYGSFLKG